MDFRRLLLNVLLILIVRHYGVSTKYQGKEMDHQSSDEGQYSGKYLYRVCRRDEDPAQGLEARDPTAIDVTPSSHVHGKKASPFISTTSTYEAMQMYYGLASNNSRRRPGRIVRIDRERLSRVRGIQIIDLGDPEVADREFSLKDWRGKNYASKYKEVLVKGKIPADCIEVLEDVEESDSFDVEDYSSEDGEEESSNQSEGTQDKNPHGKDGDASSDDDREDDHSSERTKRRKQNDEDDISSQYMDTSMHLSLWIDINMLMTPAAVIGMCVAIVVGGLGCWAILSFRSRIKLETLSEEYKESLRSFITRREKTIRMLTELAKLLNDCRKERNNTKIASAGASIAGAGACLLSIPLTGGLSALALAAGTMLGMTGGMTGMGGEIYASIRESDLMRRAEIILQDDRAEGKRLEEAGTALQLHMKRMNIRDHYFTMRFRVFAKCIAIQCGFGGLLSKTVSQAMVEIRKRSVKRVTKSCVTRLAQPVRISESIARKARIAIKTNALLTVVFIPFDIWQIVSSLDELSMDNSEMAQQVIDLTNVLEKDLKEKKLYILG